MAWYKEGQTWIVINPGLTLQEPALSAFVPILAPDMVCSLPCPDQPGFNSSCEQCLAEREAGREGPIHPLPTTSTNTSTDNLCQVETRDPGEAGEARGGRLVEPMPGRTYECEDVCRKTTMIVFSTIGMTVILLGYLVLGAVTFSTVESKYLTQSPPLVMNSNDLLATLDKEVNSYIDTQRELTVRKLWAMTEQMNILYPDNWTRNAAKEILSFQLDLSRKLAAEMMSMKKGAARSSALQYVVRAGGQTDWSVTRGFLYSLSLLTTIGREIWCLKHKL